MYEELLINKVLQEGDINIIIEHGLTPQHFLLRESEVTFLFEHYRKYGNIPDGAIFLNQFQEFEIYEVRESTDFLVYKVKEATVYKEFVPVLKEVEKKIREDSIDAMQFLQENIAKIISNNPLQLKSGVDIIKDAEVRLKEYQRRSEIDGLLGITTGIDLLDEYTHGWMGEDLITIFARTNEGKSWILLYFLIKAWESGKKVLLYSGEMSADIVGFRIDTYISNISNMGLMGGDKKIRKEYETYINELKEKDGFVVVTPQDFGGRKPTVDDLANLYESGGFDLMGVDQLTLMEDARRGENKRIKYSNISEDLFLLSERIQKPILLVTQANRDIVKDKDKDKAPELHHIGESDGVGQNSTRVISIRVIDEILKLNIKKNRYGLKDNEILLQWNIDKGIMRPLVNVGDGGDLANDFGF